MAFNKRKRDYPWLSGDDSGAYCSPCKRIYHSKCLSSNHGCFITTPFNNWKKSTGSNPADNKLLKHQLSNAHKTAIGIASQSTDQNGKSVKNIAISKYLVNFIPPPKKKLSPPLECKDWIKHCHCGSIDEFSDLSVLFSVDNCSARIIVLKPISM